MRGYELAPTVVTDRRAKLRVMTDLPDPTPARVARRPPTMRDVAAHVGVSRQLVSLVLRGVEGPSEGSRRRILDGAREIGYRPNVSAQLLRQRRSRLVGLLFSMRNPFQVRFAERLVARAADSGFGVVLGPVTDERPSGAAVGQLLGARVEAVIAFNAETEDGRIAEAGAVVPFVMTGEWSPDPAYDNVHVDERAGLRLAVEHLHLLGHRRIAYVGGLDGRVGADRATAYREAMTAARLAAHIEVLSSGFSEEGGASAARALLRRAERPTAVICCGDQCAEGVMGVLTRAGVPVPEEISVVGFDDSYVSSLSYLRLTSVQQDVESTLEACWQAVLGRLDVPDGPRQVIATPSGLTVRESTGPVPSR